MRYTARGDSPATPAMHITIDALLAEARQVERERTLLEVRRDLGQVTIFRPTSQSYSQDYRSAKEYKDDALAMIDRKLAR